ncbi:hypothetical protein HYU18_05160 [Candidatus Woesearchaeota archaeon]|nr:hypothetical protein [Candidatus Woesearchaeota archaeon]
MNLSRSLFVVLVMSIVAMMLSSLSLAAPPATSVSGVPANVVAGTSFKVTVTGTAAAAPVDQAITAISLTSNNENVSVSSPNQVSCTAGSKTCVAEFNVGVSAAAPVGMGAILTATTIASNGEVDTEVSATSVSGSPTTGNRPPVRVDAVEVDGFELSTSETNVRDLERGEDFTLKVKLTASANAKNVEIRAFVSGFEFSRTEPISDSTSPFDVEAGVSYVKSLKLSLPERADEDRYRVRVIVSGRDTEEIVRNFRIKVTPSEHEVVIRDFSVSPEEVQSGRAVLATVRVKNVGDSTEDDISIRVSIPELGVTAAPDFVDRLESDESATSEEFFLRIDPCAKPGTYDVKAEVTFEEGDAVVTEKTPITVTRDGACQSAPAVSAGGVKIYEPQPQTVQAGGSAASYQLTIVNEGSSTKVYTLSVTGADWATVRFSPSNVVTVKPGDTQTVQVVVSAERNAPLGGQPFNVRVKDQAGDVVKDLSLSATVVAAQGGVGDVANLVQLLQIGLIALIVVLVVVGLVVAFRRMKGPKEGEEGTQTYY